MRAEDTELNPVVLERSLPAVRAWIDTFVEQHRPVARCVESLGFARLPAYFEAETLRKAFVVEVDSVSRPPVASLGLDEFADFEQMSVDGITYRDIYFLNRTQAHDESLHFHELVHIVQWQVLGPERFIMAYALGHALSGGYANNPLEQIAYALQDQFAGTEPPFAVEPLIRLHLDQITPKLLGAISR